MPGHRLRILLAVAMVVSTPAVALRAACVGGSCPAPEPTPPPPPFCDLPATHRGLVVAGYREGRSPEILATAGHEAVVTTIREPGAQDVPWPSLDADPTRVPIVFTGAGISRGELPGGTGLDAIAPTLAGLIGIDGLVPRVRSGRPLTEVGDDGGVDVVVAVVWKGIGTQDLVGHPGDSPWLTRAMATGAGTLDGLTGALPVDPIAGVATIGTGGLPAQHGVTGRLVRGEDGRVVRAMAPGAPIPVVATLAEVWDEQTDQATSVALVGGEIGDRALVGGNWYVGSDDDDLALGRTDPVAFVRRRVAAGFGLDGGGFLGVVLQGPIAEMDATTRAIERAIEPSLPRTVMVVAGTGSLRAGAPQTTTAAEVADSLAARLGADVIRANGSDGFFLDADAASAAGVGADGVAEAMRTMTAADGSTLFADAYPGFSVSLARYC